MKSFLATLCGIFIIGPTFGHLDSVRSIHPNRTGPVKPEPRQGGPVVPEPRATLCSSPRYIDNFNYIYRFTSPGYPSSLIGNVNCDYVINSPPNTYIHIECTDFELPPSNGCQVDSFQLFLDTTESESFCGRGTFERTTQTNSLTMGLRKRSGYWTTYKFQCYLRLYESSNSNQETVAEEETAGDFFGDEASATDSFDSVDESASADCECGARNEVARIVNGEDASKNEFPWRCGLYAPAKGPFCGCTIINEEYVMTAAHCTHEISSSQDLFINIGDHDLSKNDEVNTQKLIKCAQIIEHENYNSETQDNDVALCKLEKPLEFTKEVQPACLPWNMRNNDYQGATVTASGWGTTSYKGQQSLLLQKVDLPVLTTTECQRYYGSSVTQNMFCTYKPGSDTCQGDSGGSIDYENPSNGRYYAVGVVSWGVGCASSGKPGVYAKVSNYLSWIEENTGNTQFCKA